MKQDAARRTALMRALHAEGLKRSLDHEALRDLAADGFGVVSLSQLNTGDLGRLFQQVAGRDFHAKLRRISISSRSRRKAAGTEGRSYATSSVATLVDPSDCELLYALAYGDLGWTGATLRRFIARQLSGREQIRTMGDLNKVLWPVKRMVRAKQKEKEARGQQR